ncbi:MAG: phage tail tape measure protein, partial [Synergistaceae bacterium]|nr:phage tail tape measure protein [Synergistaceae bacterium]
MAGKVYDVQFLLNAQTGSSYSATFSKAQAEIAKISKEISSLSKVQSDISSYQKQQQAVENTKQKLAVLQQQYDNIQKEIRETGEFSSDLENKLLSKQQQIDKTSAALASQTEKLNRMGDALQEAGHDMDNLSGESAELGKKIDALREEQEQAANSAQKFGAKSVDAINDLSSVLVSAGIVTMLKEIADGFAECVEVTAAFEASMSNVEALSGASASELNELNALAKELGATTKFTAKESADAMGYMAMAGWNAEQMLSGMPGVLQLAAASGEDLAMVSDIVTDSLTAFGLTAADTSRYADILAQTATKANTNVSMMGETFKYAAPLAGALGYDVEDVAVATGLMANAGIKGSEAGTTLRNIFTRLAKPTKESADAMKALGLSMSDGTGHMYTWMELMEQMRDQFAGLTEEEQTLRAAELAGQRSMSGLLAIVNASEDDFAKLSAAISDSAGAAERMAGIKMDNMQGQLTLLQSAWEAVQTTVGEQFTPTLQDLFGWGAKVLGEVNQFLQAHPGLVKAIAITTTGLLALTAAVVGFNAASKVLGMLDLAAMFATPVGPILAVTAGVVALTGVIVGLNEKSKQGVLQVKDLTEASRDLEDTLRTANETMADTGAEMLATSRMANAYIDSLESMPDAVDESNERHGEYMRTLQLLTMTVPELADKIDLETGAIEGGTAALRENMEAWEQNARAQAYQSYLTSLQSAYNDVLQEQIANEIKLTQEQTKAKVASDGMAETYQKLLERLGMTDEQFKQVYGTVSGIPWRQYGQDVKDLKDEYAAYSSDLDKAEKSQRNLKKAMDESAGAVAEADEAMRSAKEAYDQIIGPAESATEATQAMADGSEQLSYAVSEVSNEVSLLVEAYNEAYDAALKSVQGQYAIWDEAEKVVAVSAVTINDALQSQISYWDSYNTNLESLRERTSDIEGLSDVIASFADGSKESVNAIAGMANASDEDLAAMVENYQALQKAQEDTSQSLADLKANFSNEMDALQEDLKEDVAALDMSAEAAAAGQATIEAFIKAANDQLPQVQAAYDRLGLAAANGLARATGTSIDVSTNTRGRVRSMGHFANGTD